MLQRDHDYRVRPWLVPSLYAAVASVAAMTLPRLEATLLPVGASLSTSAAMTIYSSVASGMIALTGIVFSLTFVMVQFSASAYSPRLVLLMARDPCLAHALGIFIATFVYAIAALAWVDRVHAPRVPLISGWLVIVLLLGSMGMFIALIERVSMLQVNRMLTFTADQGRKVIASMYAPIQLLQAPAAANPLDNQVPTQTLIHHGRPRAIQSIDVNGFVQLASDQDVVIEVLASVGDVVVELTPVLHVYGGSQRIDERVLIEPIHMGEQRTFNQDPKYALRLLVDIAIKALSPAINDPTTATQALDQIGDLLVRLGLRRLETGIYTDGHGKLRLVVPFPSWEDFLRLAFDEIRHYGADSVQVMRRMRALVADLISVLPDERRPALAYWQQRLQGTITRSFSDIDEQTDAAVEDRQGLGTPHRRSTAAA